MSARRTNPGRAAGVVLAHAKRTELNFDGQCSHPGCRRDITPGRRFCRSHTKSDLHSKSGSAGYWSDAATHLLTLPPKYPPPAWLSDPSLLPKRPPGCVS